MRADDPDLLIVAAPIAGTVGEKVLTFPALVEERGDCVLGLNSSAIATLAERTTRFTTLLHLPRMEGRGALARRGAG